MKGSSELIRSLESDMSNLKFSIGQWVFELSSSLSAEEIAAKIKAGETPPIDDYKVYNPDPHSGAHRFYELRPGQYKEPLMHREPSLKVALPIGMQLIEAKQGGAQLNAKDLNDADKMLVGYVLHDKSGLVTQRMSNSNALKHGITPVFNADGSLMVAGHRYAVTMLLVPDKNRMRGYDAHCAPLDAGSAVPVTKVADLEDIKFS